MQVRSEVIAAITHSVKSSYWACEKHISHFKYAGGSTLVRVPKLMICGMHIL